MLFQYLKDMAPFCGCALAILLFVRGFRLSGLKQQNRQSTFLHEGGVCLLWLWIAGVASQTIIPPVFQTAQGEWRFLFGGGTVNLIPFKVFSNSYQWVFKQNHPEYFVIYFLGNILMFTPIGFFLCLLWDRVKAKHAVLLCTAGSVFIEVFQLFLPRETDIDDVWLNAFGGFLGVVLFWTLQKAAPQVVCRFRLKDEKML